MTIAIASCVTGTRHAPVQIAGQVLSPAAPLSALHKKGSSSGLRTSRVAPFAPMTWAAVTQNNASGGEVA
jgi:hypothetical protein